MVERDKLDRERSRAQNNLQIDRMVWPCFSLDVDVPSPPTSAGSLSYSTRERERQEVVDLSLHDEGAAEAP